MLEDAPVKTPVALGERGIARIARSRAKERGQHRGMEFWGVMPEPGGERGDTRGDARIRRLRLMLVALVISLMGSAAPALAADISACGTTISKPGFYRLTQDLSAASGDCIDVSAPHTVLFLNGKKITGSGSGIGVHLLARANHSFIEGGNGAVSGFAVGIEDDAAFLRADNFSADRNASGGVLLSGASNSTVSNFEASHNGSYGVRLIRSNNSVVESAMATGNGAYGFWLDGAKGVRVDNFDVEQNATAGLYIGCAQNGPGSACARGGKAGSSNVIYNGFADGNGPYGIAIDSGSAHNMVTSVESMNNKTADMLDAAANCGSDSWFGNAFSSASAACIN
jgi:parallel beta-helix repeat protein